MNLMGLQGGQYQPLSPDQIETIHKAALQILESTGMAYEAELEDVICMLEEHGATIDREKKHFTLPASLVRECADKAPQSVTLCGRIPENDLILEQDRVHLGTGGAAIRILDPQTGQARPTTLTDLYSVARLVDQLENIHFLVRPCIPTDIDKEDYDINMYYACLKASAKHVMSGINDEEGLHRIIDMAALIAGSREALQERPFISVITSFAISPLKLCTQSTRIMLEAIRNGIPVALSSAPMAGSTSPMTMAGTLVQLHAEELAGITLCQLTRPGAPLLYGGIPGMANMATMGYCGGGVECGIMNAAIHQLARHIQVPNYNSSGLSDSKVPDIQAGYEKAFTAALATMGGSNYIHHSAGMLESMLTIAYEQYVIDNEIIGNACKILQGISVDAEHLALEVIDSVGPAGNFMMAPHTMKHMRTEYYSPAIADRTTREMWTADGEVDARTRALNHAQALLANEHSYISEKVDRVIREKYNILLPA